MGTPSTVRTEELEGTTISVGFANLCLSLKIETQGFIQVEGDNCVIRGTWVLVQVHQSSAMQSWECSLIFLFSVTTP